MLDWIAQSGLQSNLVDWNPILSLDCQSILKIGFVGISIVNHIFVMDLDWINNPK